MLVLAGTSFAATINVPGDQPTIAAAISASVNGDVIAIAAGTYYEHSLNPNGKGITIGSASGNLDVIIDAQQASNVFNFSSGEGPDGTVIQNLVVTGGSGDGGGGIICWNNSSPTITNCTISYNTAIEGGGISCFDSSPTITGCTIEGNTADEGGGGGIYCSSNSNPTISGCTIEGNTASSDAGGGIYCSSNSNPTITNCTIHGNSASYGGGIHCVDGVPSISYSQICGNEPEQIDGDYDDEGGNTVADECPEPGACCINGEAVSLSETDCVRILGLFMGEGTYPNEVACAPKCSGDAYSDGVVNIDDLLIVVEGWGPCP
jgi:parallel beta-helix repeat protein